jgi:hypothetical protein
MVWQQEGLHVQGWMVRWRAKPGMWLQGLHAQAGCPAFAQLLPKGKPADLAAGYATAVTP